jgi:tetratricopeptide (TPR) repeat protein
MMGCRPHDGRILALEWNSDGRRLAIAGSDGVVKIVDANDGLELLSLRLPQPDVRLLDWSPDGRRLAAADTSGTIHIWDASRGYAFAPDGSRRSDLAWAYYQRADETKGHEANEALQMAVLLAPRTLGFRLLRGPALARLGEYDEAAKEFAAAVLDKPELGLQFALWQAYALLGARDLDAYRDLHQRLAQSVRDSEVWSKRLLVGWLGALVPGDTEGFEENVKMVRESVAKDKAAGKSGFETGTNALVISYGAMLYRTGEYQEAANVLTRLGANIYEGSDRNGQYTKACQEYFLAMARYQLGHKFQAQRLLVQARATDESLREDLSIPWSHLVVLDTLAREARNLINP